MSPQITCISGCIVALVAFVWLFSAVRFQMRPQTGCTRRCKITLAAFVWLFSTVCFQMPQKIACVRGCIVTLVAFVWLFSTVCLQMCPFFCFIRYEGQWQIDCATHLALKNTSGNVLQTDVITRFVQWMFVGLMWHQEPGHLLHQCGRPPSLAGQPLQGLPKIQGHSVRQWQQKWLGAGFTGIRTSSLSAVGDRGGGWL